MAEPVILNNFPGILSTSLQQYSAGHCFWPMDEMAELADESTGFGEVARGRCLLETSM